MKRFLMAGAVCFVPALVFAQADVAGKWTGEQQGRGGAQPITLDGSACDPDHVRESVLYPAVDRAGIQRVSRSSGFHAFRHAGSSIINEVTGDLKLSQIQLGHKRISTTANMYTHTNMRQVERAGEVAKEIAHQIVGGLPTRGNGDCRCFVTQ